MEAFSDSLAPVYVYDGSFDGLLCCLFAMYERKEIPADIVKDYGGFLPSSTISSDDEKAARVRRGLVKKLGREAVTLGEHAYLSEREGIEKHIALFWKLGLQVGVSVYKRLADDCVASVFEASKYTMRERHRILQFLRFADSGEALTAVISPHANVLPLIAGHFIKRFPREKFFIYDDIRRAALVYADGKSVILPLEEYTQPAANEEERKYRELFRMFYETIEIKERHNERCRMNFMPKRFWKNMTEFTRDEHTENTGNMLPKGENI